MSEWSDDGWGGTRLLKGPSQEVHEQFVFTGPLADISRRGGACC